MNSFLHSVLLMGVCFVAIVTAAPTATNQKSTPEKRDIKPSAELEEIFADDTKKKRSQEVIMFGNQQNKPAGMVDDGLVRFAEKKSQKKENDEELEDENEEIEEEEEEDDDEDRDAGSSEVLPSKINVTGNLNSNAPVVAEIGSDVQDTDDTQIEDKTQNGFGEEEQNPDSYLPKNLLPVSHYEEDDDEEEESRKSEPDPRYLSRDANEQDLSDYGNRYYSGGDVYRRNIRKRSLLTPLDKLMNAQHGARWKRDVRLSKGDVVGLLGILAAAEKAKERQTARQHSLADLESAYLDSLIETRPSDADDIDDFSAIGDNMGYLPIRYEGQDDEIVPEDVPEWTVYEPENGLELRRRSSPFYPPVDYRALGVIGNRKRSSPRHPGMWGRFEERKRFLQKEPDLGDFGGNGEEDEEDGDGIGHDEELYTLGELLNGNEVDDTRYPVYRRLI